MMDFTALFLQPLGIISSEVPICRIAPPKDVQKHKGFLKSRQIVG
jgi:hypothetical protein